MSFGEGNLRERCAELERALIAEQVDNERLRGRIEELVLLVRDMRFSMAACHNIRADELAAERMNDIDRRIRELGIEVGE